MNNDDGKRKSRKVLLVFQIAVNGQQYVESLCCELKQESIFDSRPSRLCDSLDLVTGKFLSKRSRHAFVKQHAHRQSDGLLPVRERQPLPRAKRSGSRRGTPRASVPLQGSRSTPAAGPVSRRISACRQEFRGQSERRTTVS